ncbi:hypothetical protein GP486_006683, partial [Trichoglossum hirsutum]
LLGTLQPKPRPVDPGQPPQRFFPLPNPPPQQKPAIPKPPWYQPKARNAKKGIQYLRIDLDPFAAWGVDVVASGPAHCRGSVDEQEEEHSAPGNHVEAVDSYEEAEWSDEEFPEGFQDDDGCFGPGVLGGRDVVVGVSGVDAGA